MADKYLSQALINDVKCEIEAMCRPERVGVKSTLHTLNHNPIQTQTTQKYKKQI